MVDINRRTVCPTGVYDVARPQERKAVCADRFSLVLPCRMVAACGSVQYSTPARCGVPQVLIHQLCLSRALTVRSHLGLDLTFSRQPLATFVRPALTTFLSLPRRGYFF